jgi:hypothetical protein
MKMRMIRNAIEIVAEDVQDDAFFSDTLHFEDFYQSKDISFRFDGGIAVLTIKPHAVECLINGVKRKGARQ